MNQAKKLDDFCDDKDLNGGNTGNGSDGGTSNGTTNNTNDATMLGVLPAKAPLANAYVPYQQPDSDQYSAQFGLIRGTLFPGLDLPFMGLVNTKEKTQPLNELQALNFAIQELALYLDTHQTDMEALELFNTYRGLYQEGLQTYEKLYGPLRLQDVGNDGVYNWLQDPWPWDYNQATEVTE